MRDRLLGFSPKDYDVATSAKPEEVREAFQRTRFVGEAFGVVLVRLFGHDTEVATFRKEWGYEDGRRPSHVAFTDAEHDAQRRDFTINGLFENPLSTRENDQVIDYVGGVADLQAGVLRAIGNPGERFGEDYLRMLRAVRFAARFGFAIESDTAGAIREHAHELSRISRERIGMEVRAALTGPRPALAIQLLSDLRLDRPTLGESTKDDVATPLRLTTDVAPVIEVAPAIQQAMDYPTWLALWALHRHALPDNAHSARLPNSAAATTEVAASLAAFVGERKAVDDDAGATGQGATHEGVTESDAEAVGRSRRKAPRDDQATEVVARWRDALCLTNEETADLSLTLRIAARLLSWVNLGVAARKRLLAEARCDGARALLAALRWDRGIEGVAAMIDRDAPALLEQGVAPEPLIAGDDLIAMGMQPGRHFGPLLDAVYDAQLEGAISDRDAAIAWVEARAPRP